MDSSDLATVVAQIEAEAEEYLASRGEATLMIGLSVRGERQILRLRTRGAEIAPLPDEDTIYEIGSVSKVFSTTVLGVLVDQGLVDLDDPIEKHFPATLRLPAEIGAITIRELATHSSGLGSVGAIHQGLIDEEMRGTEPPWATNTHYLRYRKEHLYADLESATLDYPTGTGWIYSVLGMGTLGHLLELVADKPYEQLLKETVCEPLGLPDLTYTLTTEQQGRVMFAYDATGQPCPNWYHDVMLPQGGLRGTVTDLLTFTEAHLEAFADAGASPLSRAMRLACQQHDGLPDSFAMPAGNERPDFVQGLGWRGLERPAGRAWWHGGTTQYYLAGAGVDEQAQVGFVILQSSRRSIVDREVLHPLQQDWFRRVCAAAKEMS